MAPPCPAPPSAVQRRYTRLQVGWHATASPRRHAPTAVVFLRLHITVLSTAAALPRHAMLRCLPCCMRPTGVLVPLRTAMVKACSTFQPPGTMHANNFTFVQYLSQLLCLWSDLFRKTPIDCLHLQGDHPLSPLLLPGARLATGGVQCSAAAAQLPQPGRLDRPRWHPAAGRLHLA